LSCVEIEGGEGWLFVAEKNGQGRSRNGGGGRRVERQVIN